MLKEISTIKKVEKIIQNEMDIHRNRLVKGVEGRNSHLQLESLQDIRTNAAKQSLQILLAQAPAR